MRDVVGKVAVITGAASGIGRGIAEVFSAAGMKVVLSDIEEAPLRDAAESIRSTGAEVHSVVADVSDADQVDNLAREAIQAFGGVQVLCNNAGVLAVGASSWESSLEDWQWNLGVNLMGAVHGVRAFVPLMIRQGDDCHVVNTASLAALVPTENSLYGTGKAALLAFTESLSLELKRAASKISVSVLCPAFVNTNILESERYRPAHLRRGAPRQRKEGSEAEHWIRGGLDARVVGEQVLAAIREQRFYIHTNPEILPYVERRFGSLLAGRRPGFVSEEGAASEA